MAVDIVPQLQENIYKLLAEKRASNEQLAMLSAKLAEGKAKYTDAHAYAKELGEMLSQTLGESVTTELLPDGTMYFNIADRVIRPLMVDDFNEIADYAVEVQRLQNELDGIGLKAVKPELNADRIDGIINRISSEPFDDVKWLLDDPLINFGMSAVDDVVKSNGEFLYRAGLEPVIVRIAEYKCCKWCSNLEGKYPYGTEPKDVYRRHERCRCETSLSRNEKKENVWTKMTYKDTHRQEIQDRIKAINEMIAK